MTTKAAALAFRTLSLPVRWHKSKPHSKGNPRAAALDQIQDLCDRWESFDPPSFWRVMASLWGRAGYRGMAAECGRRWVSVRPPRVFRGYTPEQMEMINAEVQAAATAKAGTPDHPERTETHATD